MTTNNCIMPMKVCFNTSFTLINNPKDLDPSWIKIFGILLEGKKFILPYKFYVLGQIGLANSADQDQTASEEAV